MTGNRPYPRPKKYDRLLSPGAAQAEIVCAVASKPFDEAVRASDLKWGIDRLPGLVPAAMAEKYGKALAALNAALEASDPDATRQNAENCAKGLAAMNAAAEAAGAPKADTTVWEYDCDGYRFGIMADEYSWQAAKAARPDLHLRTMREVGNALRAYDHVLTGEIATETVAPVRPRTDMERELDDEIPF